MSPFFKNRHPRGDLSAYIDGQLEPKRAATTEAHLTSCLECSAELAELRELRSALGAMPEVTAPRSFILTPEQIAQTVRTSTAQYRPTPLVTGLRLGSAGLAMALAVVLVIDAGGGPGDPGRDDTAFEMQADTDSRSTDNDILASEGSAATSSPPVAPTGGAGIEDGTTRDPNTTAEATPLAGAAPAVTTVPDEVAPTGDGAIAAYDGDDGGGEAYAPDEGKAADRSTTSSDGYNDLLVIEIILGVAAVLVLLASVFVARSRRQSI